MTDYHSTYVGDPDETTEWEDIQRRHGILAPKVRPPLWICKWDSCFELQTTHYTSSNWMKMFGSKKIH